jgi:hypothetical protein
MERAYLWILVFPGGQSSQRNGLRSASLNCTNVDGVRNLKRLRGAEAPLEVFTIPLGH